jgi:tetratricopeptide (TPR) repeat protein
MRVLACAALIFGLISGTGQAFQSSFEDLARRAESVIDSKPAEPVDLFKKALVLKTGWAEGWLYLGASLYQLDRFAEASDAFRKGIALAPTNGTGWAFLGLCEAELDNSDQAIADIRKGEQLGLGDNWPFEVAVRVKAAQTLIRAAAFDEALAQMVPLSAHKENSAVVRETMGMCAMAIAKSASELPPERRAVVNLAGKAAWESASQRPAEAAAAYRELLQRYPNEAGVHYAYGLYLMETDLAAALKEFQKEVESNPDHWPALIEIGSLEVRQGNAEEGLQSLRRAIKVVPARHRWLCHAELGRANMTAGNVEAAIGEFETARRLMPGNPQVHFFLSQMYRRAGRKEDAQRETAEFEKLKAQQDPLGVPGLLQFRP